MRLRFIQYKAHFLHKNNKRHNVVYLVSLHLFCIEYKNKLTKIVLLFLPKAMKKKLELIRLIKVMILLENDLGQSSIV